MEATYYLRKLLSHLLTPQLLIPTSTRIFTRLSTLIINQDQLPLLLLRLLQLHLCLPRPGTVATLGMEGP